MRSAWLANLLTWGKSFCWHDGFFGLDKTDDFQDRMKMPGMEIVGNSDPGNVLYFKKLLRWYPEAPWVIVRRNFEDSLRSSNRAFGKTGRHELEFVASKLDQLKEADVNLVQVAFEDLDDPQVIQHLADYCGVDIGPKERVAILLKMQVQIRPDLLKKAIREELQNWSNQKTENLLEIVTQ